MIRIASRVPRGPCVALMRGAILFACILSCTATTSTAAVVVYGGPTYTPGAGGYLGPTAFAVTNNGVAIGNADFVTAALQSRGSRTVRWDASGSPPVELEPLATNSQGTRWSQAYVIGPDGRFWGHANKFVGGDNDTNHRAVRWNADGSGVTELQHLGISPTGALRGSVGGINASGIPVGHASKYVSGVYLGDRPVQWSPNGTVVAELPTLGTNAAGVAHGHASSINAAGTMVGLVETYDGQGNRTGVRAVRWNAGTANITDLGHLGVGSGTGSVGTSFSAASEINDAGTIMGRARKYDTAGNDLGDRAVRWAPGSNTPVELGTLATPGGFTRPSDMNEAGTIVGVSGGRAVRWDVSSTAAVELGSFIPGGAAGEAFAINNAGLIAGSTKNPQTPLAADTLAVLWDPAGIPFDLNTLIDPASGWVLREAQAISDNGWVAGVGDFDPDGLGGQPAYRRLFVLQIPEPASIASVGLAMAVFALRRWPRPIAAGA